MPLKLPQEEGKSRAVKVPRPKEAEVDALAPEDTIEYGITMEVSPRPGAKAWIKAGVTSSVREGETTEDAEHRVTEYVEQMLERRIDNHT